MKILVIDDDHGYLVAIGRLLKALGHTVSAFNDSEAGLAHFMQHQEDFGLVLTDLDMPHVDGYDVIFRIRKITKNDDIGVPICLMSAYLSPCTVEDAKMAGADRTFQKNQGLEALEQIIADAATIFKSSKRAMCAAT